MLIKRYCDEVIICYDADEAGQKATARAISILRPTGLRIKIVTVPSGKDPDEFIKSYGEQGSARFAMLLDRSGNDIEYRLKKLRSRYNIDITDQKVGFMTQAAFLISEIDNPVEQDIYITRLSSELGIEKSAFRQLVDRSNRKKAREHIKFEQRQAQEKMSAGKDRLNVQKHYNLRAANAEEAILALMVLNPDTASYVASTLKSSSFVTDPNRRIFEVLISKLENSSEISLADLSGQLTQDEMSSLARMLASRPRENDPRAAADEYISVLLEEGEKMTPEQMAAADNDTIMEQLRKMKEKKQ